MHPLRFLFIPLSLASVILSRPLEITPVVESIPSDPDGPMTPDIPLGAISSHSNSPEIQDRIQKIVEAKNKVNLMLPKMKHVIEDPFLPAHKEIIKTSFGKWDGRKADKIKETIDKMQNANIRARVDPLLVPVCENMIPADTGFVRPAEGAAGLPHGVAPTNSVGRVADNMQFSEPFYQLNVDGRAGTLIHEAARYTANASKYAMANIHTQKHEIRPDGPSGSGWVFRHPGPFAYNVQDLNHHPAGAYCTRDWYQLKHDVPNMQDCADAYRVFAHLCDQHTCIPTSQPGVSPPKVRVWKVKNE